MQNISVGYCCSTSTSIEFAMGRIIPVNMALDENLFRVNFPRLALCEKFVILQTNMHQMQGWACFNGEAPSIIRRIRILPILVKRNKTNLHVFLRDLLRYSYFQILILYRFL